MRSRQIAHSRPVARKQRPLVLRPALFAYDTARNITLFWFRVFLNLVSYSVGVVAFVTGKDPKEITNLSFLSSPKSQRREGETKSFGERVKGVASKALPTSYEVDSLREQLNRSNLEVAELRSIIADQRLQQASLASNMIVNEIAHEIHPDPRDELEVEQKLLNLLQSRMQDTKEAEEYRQSAETQAVYYNGVIEGLRSDLMKELEVIEHQQEDKQTLEKKMEVARSLIDTLKEKLTQEEERRTVELQEQKKKFKAQQERVTSEFKTATDFCKDLRRKLEAETKHKALLEEANAKLERESEEYHERVEELSEKLRASNVALQEERNQFAQLKKEREMEIERFQAELKEVNNNLTINREKTVVLKKKNEEERTKQLEKSQQELKQVTRKYEAELKEAKRALEAELAKHEAEHKISRELIATLQHKDTEDVQKEKAHWVGELKRVNGEHKVEVERLNAKLANLQEEVAAAAVVSTMLKEQYDNGKTQLEQLEKDLAASESRVNLLQSDLKKSENALSQLKKELEHERSSVSTKIELERRKAESSQADMKKELTISFKKETERLEEELNNTKTRLQQSEARLEHTKKDLVSRIAQVEQDRKEALARLSDAKESVRARDIALTEASRGQEAATRRAEQLSATLQEEQRRSETLKSKLEVSMRETFEAKNKRDSHVLQLEKEVEVAKNLIDTLKQRLNEESANNAALSKQWNEEKAAREKQLHQLEETLAQEKEALAREHERVAKLKTQNQGLEDRNSVLVKDVQATSEKATNNTVINEQVKVVESV